jgi:hypothetical protein
MNELISLISKVKLIDNYLLGTEVTLIEYNLLGFVTS